MNAAEKLELVPDLEAARALFADLDQIHLVAINPGNPDASPIGRDFALDGDAAVRWAQRLNADGLNIYWTVNAVRPGLDKKPLKADMIAARFVHVDIDPPKDGSVWSRDEVLATLRAHRPEPSFVIDSGNGLQVFWRLKEPIENKAHAEAVNIQLIHHFGGELSGVGGVQNASEILNGVSKEAETSPRNHSLRNSMVSASRRVPPATRCRSRTGASTKATTVRARNGRPPISAVSR